MAAVTTGSATDRALWLDFSISQIDTAGEAVILWDDSTLAPVGVRASGFFSPISMELDVESVDSLQATFTVHLVSFGPPNNSTSRRITTEHGIPFTVGRLAGKNDALYEVRLSSMRPEAWPDAECRFDHWDPSVFSIAPSANFDLLTIPTSLAGFYVQALRSLLEGNIRRFDLLNQFSIPGKAQIYIAPCAVPTILWDDRFNLVVDPTRNAVFTIYDKAYTSVSSFAVMLPSIYRNYGYAPPFLAEGYAGYFSSGVFELQLSREDLASIAIDPLLDTYEYLTSDPEHSDRVAMAFCRFLIQSYSFDSFLRLYRAADDLNLRTTLTATYGMSIDSLESAFLTYLDTVDVSSERIALLASEAEVLLQYDQMNRYWQTLWDAGPPSRSDSLTYAQELARSSFYRGDYYAAQDWRRLCLSLDENRQRHLLPLAAYTMMTGDYGVADSLLAGAWEAAEGDPLLAFNYGLLAESERDLRAAADWYRQAIAGESPSAMQVEARVMLGLIDRATRGSEAGAAAKSRVDEALRVLQQRVTAQPSSALNYLWTGLALVVKEDLSGAWDYLQTGLFLETRPYYRGWLNLWSGKLSDLRGERDVARDFYGAVVTGAAAAYHVTEARRYLAEAYGG